MQFLQSFIKSTSKLSIFLFLLGTHFFVLGKMTQHPSQPEKTTRQPFLPIKVNLVTLPKQNTVKPKKVQKKVQEIAQPKKILKKRSVEKKSPKNVVKIPKKVTIKKTQQKSEKQPIRNKSTTVKKVSKRTVIPSQQLISRSKSVPASKKAQIPMTKPVLESKPVLTAERSVPIKSRQKPPIQQQSRQPSKPIPRKQGKTTNPSYQGNPLKPPYPNLSRKRGEEGTVHLRVQVSSNGTPSSVTLAKSSGYSRLDNAAMRHVKQWQFTPAKKNGKAVTGTVIIPIRFRLK
jgi:protein TonB